MPGGKRKLEVFDPNKSDSDDVDYKSDKDRPRRSAKKSRTQPKKSSSSNRRRTKYKGSDISDEEISDSLLEDSYFEEEVEEEEAEMDPHTGRRKRQAKAKKIDYQEDSESDILEGIEDDSNDEEEEKQKPVKRQRPSRLIKLKLPTPKATRSTRAGSAAQSRAAGSVEPTSAGVPRRSTRAHTEDGEDLVALTNSGRHVEVIRSSRSPETAARERPTRGKAIGTKLGSMIKEEEHESSSTSRTGQQRHAAGETQATEVATEEQEADLESKADSDGIPEAPSYSDLTGESQVLPATGEVEAEEDDEDEDEDAVRVTRGARNRASRGSVSGLLTEENITTEEAPRTTRRLTRNAGARKAGNEQSSDFEPAEESAEEDVSSSDASPKKGKGDSNDTDGTPRRGRSAAQRKSKSNKSSRRRASDGSEEDDDLDQDELIEEVQELKAGRRGNRQRQFRTSDILYERDRRARKPVDYTIKPMDQIYAADEDADDVEPTQSRAPRGRRNGGTQSWERPLYTTYGPFGGAGGPTAVIGGPWGTGAAGGVDSDSSDDENMQRQGVGGNVGMTPTSAMAPALLPPMGQTYPTDLAASMGTAGNFGKVKSQKLLADADPLGVDQYVDFSKVGGLAGHIDQLKEMVQMPLLYPELFLKFHVTPPRGVLFHGPPGTGKTLLARALAASVGTGGQKITFYMRKGADALSKWVGEAEKQLRLLFEEARRTQPSIIFFDEIDGLAPVRSSKQEQIHASIVSTLLALMDGMDGRGQVIVIGATNRPDNIDPALRRPGRFDREFYFPLPDIEGRLSIINIHTRDWGIDDDFKNSLARITKGYGGADIRALCTEAALNAMQRTYPQIYSSTEKLVVDPDKIKITAKDFMLSIKKMIPSSERATSSGAAPLPKTVEPLLRGQLKALKTIVDGLIPIKKKVTALQEAMFEQYDDADQGFGREALQQEFENSRVYRPRLLIEGKPGMGQAYIASALLHHFEGLHVQNFDLPTMYADSARSGETAIVQLFAEVKRHKPSVIFLPGVDTWYHTLSEAVITTFLGLLQSIPPNDPILVLGITDKEPDHVNRNMLRDFFQFSKKNRFEIRLPTRENRREFFSFIINHIKKGPKDFPDPVNRKIRKLEPLPLAPPPPPRIPTKEEIKAIKKKDHLTLNILKVLLQPIMDQIKKPKYRKFRNPVIPYSQIQYLLDEQDPNFVRPDVPQIRPFELDTDKNGVRGLRETATGRFFYNLEIMTIEERLSNGFYARPKDYLADIRTLAKDAKNIGDRDRLIAANELYANVEVDLMPFESDPRLADCENVYQRQLQRAREREAKHKKRAATEAAFAELVRTDTSLPTQDNTTQVSGPIFLGEVIPNKRPGALPNTFTTPGSVSNGYPKANRHSSDTQGKKRMSNGSAAPSHMDGDDVHMAGTDEGHLTHPLQAGWQAMQPPQPPQPRYFGMSREMSNVGTNPHGISTQSQTSAFQPLPHDISPSALFNDASTTTSGKKTSDPSNKSSQAMGTQVTNGKVESQSSPDSADSQLPDTQRGTQELTQGGTSGESRWPHSQAEGLASGHIVQNYPSQTPSSGSQLGSQLAPSPFSAPPKPTRSLPPNLANLMNSPVEPSPSQSSSLKELVIDEAKLEETLNELTKRTSGCTIEQLEQINRELMDTLWKTRGEYNRTKVGTQILAVFNDVIADIEEMQKVLQPSQELD